MRLTVLAVALSIGARVAVAAPAPRAAPASGKKTAAPRPRPPASDPPAPCKKPAPRARLKLNLKPDIEVADLIAWYSATTCTPVLLSSAVPVAGKKVTIMAPTPVTVAELRQLFLAALESVGLAVEPMDGFQHVIEASRARQSATPVQPGR